MKENKKSNKNKLIKSRVFIVVVVLIFIIVLIKNAIYSSIYKNESKNTRVLLNNEIVSVNNQIQIDEKNVYISEDDVKNIFDKSIYYNVGDKELITTYNNHVAVLHLDSNEMKVNDTSIQIEAPLKEIDSKIYLPINELGIVYDIETEYSTDSNIVVLDSTNKAKTRALVLRNTNLKASRLPFSATIEKVKQGSYVYIIEGKGRLQKVRSENGNIGYIKTKRISDKETLRENLEEENKKINILKDYSDITQKYDDPKLDSNKDNVVILNAFESTKSKEISNKIDITSDDYKNYSNWAEKNDIDIIGNYKNSLIVSANMATYNQRNEIINQLYNNVMQNLFKGICLEFQEIDDINSFYRLLIEMKPKFKESGLKLIVKLNGQMDKEKVKDLVDCCVNE